MSKLYDLLAAMIGKIRKSDWNQDDETAPDYIKNRTHWYREYRTILLTERTLTCRGYSKGSAVYNERPELEIGKTYVVTWDNVDYECVCKDAYGGRPYLGNTAQSNYYPDVKDGFYDSGEPFHIICLDNGIDVAGQSGEHTFLIAEAHTETKQLDEKYLPDYVRNRTHYEEDTTEVLFEAKSVYANTGDAYYFSSPIELVEGETYFVEVNGVTYERVAVLFESKHPMLDFSDVNALGKGKIMESAIYMKCQDVPVKIYKGGIVVHPLDEKYLPDSVKAQPDWEQSDETSPAHVKNRTHYAVKSVTTICNETITLSTDPYYGNPQAVLSSALDLIVGDSYTLYVDGVEKGTATLTDSNRPLAYNTEDGVWEIHASVVKFWNNISNYANPCTFRLDRISEEIHHLDEKYIPDTIARVSDVPIEAEIVNAVLAKFTDASEVGM